MTEFDSAAKKLIAQVWGDIQRRSRDREYDEAKANPDRHAMTRVMEKGAGTNYTYWRVAERKTKSKQFDTMVCVSKGRNAAGNFLIWRQVETYRRGSGRRRGKWLQTERFDFRYSPSKREAFSIAERWSGRLAAEEKAAADPREARPLQEAGL